jgi:hypothetical protein
MGEAHDDGLLRPVADTRTVAEGTDISASAPIEPQSARPHVSLISAAQPIRRLGRLLRSISQ